MKSLVIAEKPSVARDLCKVLGGKFEKMDEYFENENYVVTSAVGHIVELFMPEDYDKRDAFWRLANLPILPSTFKLKAIEREKSKLKKKKNQPTTVSTPKPSPSPPPTRNKKKGKSFSIDKLVGQ